MSAGRTRKQRGTLGVMPIRRRRITCDVLPPQRILQERPAVAEAHRKLPGRGDSDGRSSGERAVADGGGGTALRPGDEGQGRE